METSKDNLVVVGALSVAMLFGGCSKGSAVPNIQDIQDTQEELAKQVFDASVGLTEEGCTDHDGIIVTPTGNYGKRCCIRVITELKSTGEAVLRTVACCGPASGQSCTEVPVKINDQ